MQFTTQNVDDAIFYCMRDSVGILVETISVYYKVKEVCSDCTPEQYQHGLNIAPHNYPSLKLFKSEYRTYLYFEGFGKGICSAELVDDDNDNDNDNNQTLIKELDARVNRLEKMNDLYPQNAHLLLIICVLANLISIILQYIK
jgi:hypothetical protein